MHRHARTALLAALMAAFPAVVLAQPYPSRAINMIIPFPPGGNTDLMGRALQDELRKALGQTVVIQNRGGAAGTLGIIELARAAPDGYTIAMTPNNPLTAQPHMRKLPYGMDSFRFICLTYYSPYVLMAGPKAPFKTFKEFVAFAKGKPENLVYGHPGVGSQPHLGMLAVLKALNVQALGVPFQGAGPMSQALLGGTVMAIAETPAVAQASNLPILAALTDERISVLPDVPTMKELGFPALGFTAGGLIALKDTPAEVAATLEKACEKAVTSSEYKVIAERLKAEPRYLPGPAFRLLFDVDSGSAAAAIKDAGLTAK
jgi:tripartite-type tricarboxylate transporter receptor subunit TctC